MASVTVPTGRCTPAPCVCGVSSQEHRVFRRGIAAVRPSAIFASMRNGIPLVTSYMGVVIDREGGDDRWRQHRKGNALVQHRATLSS